MNIADVKHNDTERPDPRVLAAELRAQLSTLRRRLREQAVPGNLSSSQIAVILRLESLGEATVSELSRLEGVRPQSMRNTVMALRDSGYLEGKADPGDARKIRLSLTEEGHSVIARGRTVWNDWLSTAISETMNDEEQRRLADAVGLLRRLTGY